MSTAPASALIVRLSSIGDVIHTVPAYMALRHGWPQTRFGWAVETAAADLVRRLPGNLVVHELPIQQWRDRPLARRTRGALRTGIRSMRELGYEIAIDFQGLIKSALVGRASRAPVLGFARTDLRERLAAPLYQRAAGPAPTGCHVVHRNLHLAATAGVPSEEVRFPPLYNIDDERFAEATIDALGLERFAVIHTAANWPSKRYAPERYVEAARTIHDRTGLRFLWIWGPGEQALADRLAARAGGGSHVAPATRLPQAAALIHRARLFIGGDSAPLHLAVASETPAVAVFGPTDPSRLGPLDPADAVVCNPLPCSYCHQRRCRYDTRECLETIPVEVLVSAVMKRLRETDPTVSRQENRCV